MTEYLSNFRSESLVIFKNMMFSENTPRKLEEKRFFFLSFLSFRDFRRIENGKKRDTDGFHFLSIFLLLMITAPARNSSPQLLLRVTHDWCQFLSFLLSFLFLFWYIFPSYFLPSFLYYKVLSQWLFDWKHKMENWGPRNHTREHVCTEKGTFEWPHGDKESNSHWIILLDTEIYEHG